MIYIDFTMYFVKVDNYVETERKINKSNNIPCSSFQLALAIITFLNFILAYTSGLLMNKLRYPSVNTITMKYHQPSFAVSHAPAKAVRAKKLDNINDNTNTVLNFFIADLLIGFYFIANYNIFATFLISSLKASASTFVFAYITAFIPFLCVIIIFLSLPIKKSRTVTIKNSGFAIAARTDTII